MAPRVDAPICISATEISSVSKVFASRAAPGNREIVRCPERKLALHGEQQLRGGVDLFFKQAETR